MGKIYLWAKRQVDFIAVLFVMMGFVVFTCSFHEQYPQDLKPDPKCEIYDILGKQVSNDTSTLPKGVYMVEENGKTKKIIIK